MLEDKIIVQDRGFDAGLAALMQNANKGNMDPAALMAMMNNNGMGGNGCWWIWIILLFFVWGGWGGNGFGNRARLTHYVKKTLSWLWLLLSKHKQLILFLS